MRGVVSTRTSLIGRIVAASSRHPLIVLLIALGIMLAALVYTAGHFAMTADTSQLISAQLKWRQRELAFQAAFPHRLARVHLPFNQRTRSSDLCFVRHLAPPYWFVVKA